MRERYRIGVEGFSASLRDMRDAGRLPAHVDPAAAAVTLFALADGLQSRWLIDPSFDMTAQLERYRGNLIR
ncbi:TetR family transcriptional regulator C-terminal domain-containing protein [Nocardia acidivorans]|uniref:TetR family transcriptional regulator C-terminal domain-containing protein n=1 Tax=Nocardia acidivorans TaxID=404580 RepID=UPI0008365CAB|nr:TetR family transcriptional regulator C-terminal domain-containing protein [Nocardia acidivorans]